MVFCSELCPVALMSQGILFTDFINNYKANLKYL